MTNHTGKQASASAPHKEVSAFRWFFGQVFVLLRRHGGAIMMWLALGYIAHAVSQAFIAYAGQSSYADLSVRLLANVSVVWELSLTLSGISVTLYVRERGLHRNTRQRLTARITELELRIDPQRTSSQLTPRGETRKGDE
ncbi:MAG TPA: hypothetical protein VMP68_33135 [Candidatus Eisenbacteria bacterium]|nr:hypothetical protein [Candidatus Eisenbacteria bacterium]